MPPINIPDTDLEEIIIYGHYRPENKEKIEELKEELRIIKNVSLVNKFNLIKFIL